MIDTRVRAASLLILSLASILAAAACSDSASEAPGGSSGGIGGGANAGTNAVAGTFANGGAKAGSGGINAGIGGVASGGTNTGSAGLASGGTAGSADAGSAGLSTGGANAGSGGRTNAGSGGVANGGTNTGGGGVANGGTNTGGTNTGGTNTGGTGGGSGAVFHIFMLMGQSNMAGVAKAEAGDKNTDARIKVLGGCNQPAGQWNTANPPLSDCPGEKGWNLSDSVDPGIWFAKTILKKLPEGSTIGLVGTAESGESINTFVTGGSHHKMILNKIAEAKKAPNARFAGVIFHQGESDSGQSSWPDKVVQLYNEVKAAFGVSYDVPFILGELPQGGCCAGHNNLVHQAADKLPMGYWVSQDGTKVMDEYHFDHASVVLMGQRYGDKMIEALKW